MKQRQPHATIFMVPSQYTNSNGRNSAPAGPLLQIKKLAQKKNTPRQLSTPELLYAGLMEPV